MGRRSKINWTDEVTDYLITVYGQNIDNFLAEYKKQKALWSQLVEIMKKNESLPLQARENLTYLLASSKWNSLIKKFKTIFYGTLNDQAFIQDFQSFPFYDKMLKIFTEYAARQLNIKDYSFNASLDPNISAYVMNLLNMTTEESIYEKENDVNLETVSRAEKIVEKINELPQSSLNFFETKLRIEKNTPFRRKYSISTIVEQKRNAPTGGTKREHTQKEMWPYQVKIQKVSNSLKESSSNDFSGYEVEALDECSFMQKGNWKQSMESWSDNIDENFTSANDSLIPIYSSNKTEKFSIVEVSDTRENTRNTKANSSSSSEQKVSFKPQARLPKNIVIRKVEPKKSKDSSQHSNASILTDTQSFLNVPSIDESFDVSGLRAETTQPPVSNLFDGTFVGRPLNAIVPKKLVYENETSSQVVQEAPPSWFRDFLKKYNEDTKRIDAKLEKISNSLKQILEGGIVPPKKVLLSPRVSQIKRGY